MRATGASRIIYSSGRQQVFTFWLFSVNLFRKNNLLSTWWTAHACSEQQPQRHPLWEGAENTQRHLADVAEAIPAACGSLNRLENSSSLCGTSLTPITTHLETPLLEWGLKHPDTSSGNYVTPKIRQLLQKKNLKISHAAVERLCFIIIKYINANELQMLSIIWSWSYLTWVR